MKSTPFFQGEIKGMFLENYTTNFLATITLVQSSLGEESLNNFIQRKGLALFQREVILTRFTNLLFPEPLGLYHPNLAKKIIW